MAILLMVNYGKSLDQTALGTNAVGSRQVTDLGLETAIHYRTVGSAHDSIVIEDTASAATAGISIYGQTMRAFTRTRLPALSVKIQASA